MGDDFKIHILLIKDLENPKSEEINRRDWDWNFLKNLKKPGKKKDHSTKLVVKIYV